MRKYQKGYSTKHYWVGKVVYRELIVQEIEIWPNYEMVFIYKQNISRRMRDIKFSGILRYKKILKFMPEDQTHWSLKEKGSCRRVDFLVPADNCMKIKESKEGNNNFDLAAELWKLWRMTMIAIMIGALETVPKAL